MKFTSKAYQKNNDSNKSTVVQPSLKVGAVNDAYEQEADAVADKVMRMPNPSVQRKCAHCEEEDRLMRKPLTSFIQTKGEQGGMPVSQAVSSHIESSAGNGHHLDNDTKSFMESRFETDFSNVKIHTGNTASQLSQELNAQAFTVGNDIYFNSGKYNPQSDEGKHLLAHELTHTLQQNIGNIGRKIVQRYPWPYRLRQRREVSETITETISGAPADYAAWNNTYTWTSNFNIEIDALTGIVRLTVRLYSTAPLTIRRAWERAIERKWSNRMYLRVAIPGIAEGPCKFPISVNVSWVTDAARAHYTINPQSPGDTTDGRSGIGGTSSMTDWGTSDTTDVTHEFGHMLGNPEEYFVTNGTDYMSGGRRGFRDTGGGIMNNPAERIHRRHFNLLRTKVADMLGLRYSAVRVIYNNDSIPDCTADVGDFPMPILPDGMQYA